MKIIKIIASITFMFIVSMGMAQNDSNDNRNKFQLGFKAGTNYSNVYDEKTDEFNADGKFGFAGGAFMRIPIGKFVGIQPEILFSQKGFKGEGVLLGNEYEFKRTTSYIDIPLQVSIKPSRYVTIVAGPQYSYLLSQRDEFKSTAVSYDQQQEFDNDNIRKNILGVVAGLDINLGHVVLGGRLGWDIQNNRGDGTSNTPRYKNAWFQATLGYTIF